MMAVEALIPSTAWWLVSERRSGGDTFHTRVAIGAFALVDGEVVPLVADGAVLRALSPELLPGEVDRFLTVEGESCCSCEPPQLVGDDVGFCGGCACFVIGPAT
jgi:hypothetical protein